MIEFEDIDLEKLLPAPDKFPDIQRVYDYIHTILFAEGMNSQARIKVLIMIVEKMKETDLSDEAAEEIIDLLKDTTVMNSIV